MLKNIGSQVIGAEVITASDGSAFTGSVTCYVTGDGGTQALGSVGSGVCTHEGNGYHTYTPAQAETNYDLVAFTFIGSGAIPATVQVFTISYDPHDTVRLGLTAMPNAAAGAAGGLPTDSTGKTSFNDLSAAQVNAEVDTALSDYDAPTNTEMTAAFTEIKGATWSSGSDTLEHIRDKETDIETDTQDLQTQIGTAGAGLTDLGGMSTGMKAEVNAEVDTALSDYDAPTNTELVNEINDVQNDIAALNDLSSSDVQTIIETNKLDHLVAVADADDAVDNSIIAKLGSSSGDWSTFTQTGYSLQAIRQRGDIAWVTGGGGSADTSVITTNWTRTVGDNDGGTVNDVGIVDGTTFDTGETISGNYLEVDGVFTIGASAVPSSVDVWGNYNGGPAHYIQLRAYNNTDSVFEPIGLLDAGTVVSYHRFPLGPNHVNGSNQVSIKFIHQGGTGVASHVLVLDKVQVNTITPVPTLTDASVADAVWDELRAGHVDAGSYGETMATVETNIDNLDTAISTAVANVSVDEIQASALADLFNTDSGTTYGSAVSGSPVKEIADNAGGGVPPTAAAIADAVWDETLSDHLGVGSTGEALNGAGAAGDPWITSLPGAYGAGSAGYIIGNNLNIPVSTIGPGDGSVAWDYEITDGDTNPIANVSVWVSTDDAGTNIIASGVTDQYGIVTFQLDPGTVYVWSHKTGYNFTNPDTEVVS